MNITSSLAATGYADARRAALPKPAAAPGPGAADAAANTARTAAGSFAATLAGTDATTRASLTGGADPHALVQALAETELAIQTAVTMRNKVVEAYQEILRMPV